MHGMTVGDGPPVGEGHVVLRSLRLAEGGGRANAIVSERGVAFESKHRSVMIDLDSMQRIHQHSRPLLPLWIGAIGMALMIMGWRTLDGHHRATAMVLGTCLFAGNLVLRRPTLTLETTLGDCHVVHGAPSSLANLTQMLTLLKQGISFTTAREGLSRFDSDVPYPMTNAALSGLDDPAPSSISTPQAITSMLESSPPPEPVPARQARPWVESLMDGPEIPEPLDEGRETHWDRARARDHEHSESRWYDRQLDAPMEPVAYDLDENLRLTSEEPNLSSYRMLQKGHQGALPSKPLHEPPTREVDLMPSFLGTGPEIEAPTEPEVLEAESIEPTTGAPPLPEIIEESHIIRTTAPPPDHPGIRGVMRGNAARRHRLLQINKDRFNSARRLGKRATGVLERIPRGSRKTKPLRRRADGARQEMDEESEPPSFDEYQATTEINRIERLDRS